MEWSALWNDYKNLVYSIAWYHFRKSGLSPSHYEDFLAEALLLFVKAVQSYNADKSGMSTWLTIKISRGLTELRRTQARRNAIVKINYHNKLPDKQQNENLLDKIIRNLSDEARIAVMLLFELDKNSRERNKSLLKLDLRLRLKNMGWSDEKINSTFDEIEMALVEP